MNKMKETARAILTRAYGDRPNEIEEFLSEGDITSTDLLIPSFEKFLENNEDEDDEDDETADRYFSEDLYAVLNGTMTASEFRRLWGELEYDAMNCIINVGNNTIITNED